MFRRKSIDEWALGYWLLQRYAKLCFRIYYRKVSVINLHNIPVNQPVILAPNHQNALMDAMVMVCNTEFQTVFLARADIFKGKMLIRILTFLNIMPVYRIRDGIENVKRNDAVFEKTVQVLRNRHNPLGLFPEGNHGDKRCLRNLVKGLFRIAFMAQEEYGANPGVKIVPVGYDYGHYQNFRSTLFVNVGKPIEVSEYFRVYRENPVQGINQLKERYAAEISKLMIDIQTAEYYETYMALRTIFNDEMCRKLDIADDSLAARFKADKVMIDLLDHELASSPDSIKALDSLVSNYQQRLKREGLRDWVLGKRKYSIPGLLLGVLWKVLMLPLFITGLINNYIPYRFTETRVRGLKDPQFHSSFKYVTGMIAFPVYYLILIALICFIPMPAWIKWLYVLLMPATGLLAFRYYIGLRKLRSRIRYTLGVLRKKPEILEMIDLRSRIMDRMLDLTNRQLQIHADSR